MSSENIHPFLLVNITNGNYRFQYIQSKDWKFFTSRQRNGTSRDLQNHFYTRKGERLGEPEFGSDLPLYLFEQQDLRTTDLIEEDVINVIDSDPRWEFQNQPG